MARIVTPLTDNKCNTAKTKAKEYRLYDGGNLSLLIKKNGIKSWRIKYKRPDGRETETALGNYPTVTLKEAREQREQLKKLLAQGIDPSEKKKKEKAILSSGNTFEAIAREWVEERSQDEQLAKITDSSRIGRLQNYVFPIIGNRIINTLKLQDFIAVINNVKGKGAKHVPKLVKSDLVLTMRYAILKGLIESNPAVDLVGLKLSVKRKHHPALPHAQLKELLNKTYTLKPMARLTVLINLYIFIRSSELRYARWDEIDFNHKIWTIPASREIIEGVRFSHRGGKKRAYIVPLTDQVISLLQELRQYTGHSKLVFTVNGKEPINHNYINVYLRKLGYDTRKDVCGHGFRAMARSALGEAGFTKDALEKQMSHEQEKDEVEAYTHLAEYLQERRIIMQWWSDYIDYSMEHGYIPPYEFKKQQQPPANNIYYLKVPFLKNA